jgi:hypothetical protein
MCYDEAETCALFARQGKCVNSGMHRYANYCRKSCGLCGESEHLEFHDLRTTVTFVVPDLAPTIQHECVFPPEIRGAWVVFWGGKREELTISEGNISTSTLGTYVCKGKHYQKSYYKVFSAYTNGW